MDAALFEPRGWFAIDSANARVGGVVVPSLEAGLDLVGQGSVASIVGRLRPEVSVVDVDLEGEGGHAVAEAIIAWTAAEGLWGLVRPSGGAEGRCHVFLAPEGRTDAFKSLIEQLRTRFRVSARRIDLRRDVRPLSAPHRVGGVTPRPYGSPNSALAALRARPWSAGTTTESATTRRRRSSSGDGALAPRQRRRRELPLAWSEYLSTGVPPTVGGEDQSRSTVEAIATGHLLRAGHTADSAWAVITAAHPLAMGKARANERRWVRWVWNRAVEDDARRSPTSRRDPSVAAAVAEARSRLDDLQWRHPPRARPALLLVGHHILDRMDRSGSRRVPVPERNLVLDTGISDRRTIRAALRVLNGTLGALDHEAWNPAARASSSFEFEIPEATEAMGVRQFSPPSLHTPLPRGTWLTLPRNCHALWRALSLGTEPLTAAELGRRAGITMTRQSEPSRSQVRTIRAALLSLSAAGLAHCTASGHWFARAAPEAEHTQRAVAAHAAAAVVIAGERDTFRANRPSSWDTERAAAAKATRAHEQGWWNGLEPAERAQRRTIWRTRFERLSVVDQEHLKAQLAARRIFAEVDEGARHDRWLDGMAMDAYLERSVRRQAWFAGLPPPLQQAHAAAWARHRSQFVISRGTRLSTLRREHAELLPTGRAERDQLFAATQNALPGLTRIEQSG